MKRELTTEEKLLNQKSIDRMLEENEYYTFAIKEISRNLDSINEKFKWLCYEEKKQQTQRVNKFKDELDTNKFCMEEMQEQLAEGVEVKESIPEPPEGWVKEEQVE